MIIKQHVQRSLVGLLRYLYLETLFSVLYAALIYYLYEQHNLTFLASFSFVPISFFGTILSVFLAFRNNNSYARWWEARILWGDMVNASRMFGAQILTLLTPITQNSLDGGDKYIATIRKEIIYRHLACVNLVRMQLRQDIHFTRIECYLPSTDLEKIKEAVNPASTLLAIQSDRLAQLSNQGYLSDYRLVALSQTLSRFYDFLGACERIKNTPFPREYDGFVRYLIWIVILILPIYFLGVFSDDLSKMLIIPISTATTLIIGFANKAGEIMEDPFENRIHDVPMSSMCNTIERGLFDMLGEKENIPQGHTSVDNVIW